MFILNFGDYCLFYAVLDYSSLLLGIWKSKGFVDCIAFLALLLYYFFYLFCWDKLFQGI